MIKIVEMTRANIADRNRANQPFDLIGRLDIRFENGEWTYREVLSDRVTRKQYPDYDGGNGREGEKDTLTASFSVRSLLACFSRALRASAVDF